jgi:hypothetical protein
MLKAIRSDLMKSQKGFGVVEAILIVVIVGILGFTGWYVYSSQNSTNNIYDKTSNSASTKSTKNKDQTAGWKAYSSVAGQYSLKYPASWSTPTNPDACTGGLLLLGGNAQSVGKCGGDGPGAFGQMAVLSIEGDQQKTESIDTTGYKDISSKTVSVNGITGTRYQGVAYGQQDGEGIPGFANGTKVVVYVFFTSNRTYVTTYVQANSYPNVLADFDTMITKTLQFHP